MRAFVSRLATSAIALTILAMVTAAHAQPRTEADRLFDLGREAANGGHPDRACAYFRESLVFDPAAVGTLINIGDCEESLGHPATALQYYEAAFSHLSVTDERLSFVQGRIALLEQRSSRFEVRLGDGAPAGTKVTLDGDLLSSNKLGTSLILAPGNHVLVATAVGFKGSRQGVTLRAGEAKSLRVWPGPPLEAAIPTFVETPKDVEGLMRESRASAWRVTGYFAIGLGVASIWAGSVTGLFAIDRESLRADNCTNANVCNQTGYDAAHSGSTLATVSTVTFAAGALALGAGLYLVLSNPSSSTQKRAAILPTVGPHGAGLALHHDF